MDDETRTRRKILEIAREVRRHVRRAAGAYCPPSGLCGEATLALSTRLLRAGIPHEYVSGIWRGSIAKVIEQHEPWTKTAGDRMAIEDLRYHSWIEFPQFDGEILDVTADQYDDVPAIYFPANPRHYEKLETIDLGDILEEGEGRERLGLPLAGPHFRRPTRVRRHTRTFKYR